MHSTVDDVEHEYRVARTLIGEIEALRRKRRQHWRENGSRGDKRWSQEELTQLAYSGFHNLLIGRSRRVPSRPAVLRIAEYLECTTQETNDLLVAAEYLPLQVELREDDYQRAMDQAYALMHTVALPCVILGRRWQIVAMNRYTEALNAIPSWEEVPPERRSMVHLFFDPHLPTHEVHASTPAVWQRNASNMLRLLRRASLPFQHDAWFAQQLRVWQTLPQFNAFYAAITAAAAAGEEQPYEDLTTIPSRFVPTLIQERNIIVPLSTTLFPCIGFGLPHDEPARRTYLQAGCAIQEQRWEQQIHDLRGRL